MRLPLPVRRWWCHRHGHRVREFRGIWWDHCSRCTDTRHRLKGHTRR